MDKKFDPLDWTLIQSFIAVAEAGSLSGAARRTGHSQPTIGRHVRALEERLGVTLFTRRAKGFALNEAGRDALAHAREMNASAAKLRLAAEGRDTDMAGTVRITASRFVSFHLMPRIVAAIRRAEPGIQIELAPSDESENLLFREADIAVRMYRPRQLDIVARHVADLPLGLYAASAYLDRAGRPETLEELAGLDLVGFDRNDLIIRMMQEMGITVGREFFPVRCDDQVVFWELVCAGAGVGAGQVAVGDAEPRVERLLPGLGLPRLPVWLAAPEALRTTPRIRRVWDLLLEHLAAAAAP